MSSPFDHAPRAIDRRQPENFFELPPRVLRQWLPLIGHDPSFPNSTLDVPQTARYLATTGFDELQLEHDAPDEALRLVLHFGMCDPASRAQLLAQLQQEPPVDYNRFIALKQLHDSLPHLPPVSEKNYPDHKPAWRTLRAVQPLVGLKVVDYGAASGGFVQLLRTLGAMAYGIDLTDQRIRQIHRDTTAQRELVNEHNVPLLVMSRERYFREDTQQFLTGVDMFISSRLLRTVNPAPQHRQVMDVVTERLLKPGGLVLTLPSLATNGEHLDDADHYGQRYSQFDYQGSDEVWDYTVARKLF